MSEPPLAIMNAAAGQKALEHHYAMCFDHLEDDFRFTSLTQLISSMIPAGQHVLDVGCGSGALSTALLQKGCRVISQDTSREMVEMCERHLERKGLQGATWLGNLDDLCEDYAFDTIVALDVLEHIEDDQHALKRMRHLVKHDGRLILSVPAISWLYGQRDAQLGHYRRYDRPQLIALVEGSGFTIDHLQFWNGIGVLPNWYAVKFRKTRWNEDFRYAGRSPLKRIFNHVLRVWFCRVENNVTRFPCGLTLIVAADPA